MATNGKLSVEEGTVSVIVPSGAAVDAAVAGTIAGFELPLELASVFIGEQSDRRHALTLSVSLPPEIMVHLALRILEVSGTPAFNEREWRTIAGFLRTYSVLDQRHGETNDGKLAEGWADQIERAYA